MKTALLALVMLFTCSAWAQEPKRLDCQEGNLRLEADLVSKRVNLFERDAFSGDEISRFGFAQRISKSALIRVPSTRPNICWLLPLKVMGLLRGAFNLS